MNTGHFTVDDIAPYLNQKLPGFEPVVFADGGTDVYKLRVKSSIEFAAYQNISRESVFYVHGRGGGLQEAIDELIQTTRREVIQKLGLQEEIDAEVKRTIDRERRQIEEQAYKKAMDDALKKIARELVPGPSLEAVLTFINGEAK